MKPGDLVVWELDLLTQGPDAEIGLVLSDLDYEMWGDEPVPHVYVSFPIQGVEYCRSRHLHVVGHEA
jgi:hypothetical protein